jgi:hypothetical protein
MNMVKPGLARSSLWMISVQVFNKILAFFLPLLPREFLESKVLGNMVSRWRWHRYFWYLLTRDYSFTRAVLSHH